MPEYRRAFAPGGTFFFTLVTARRRPILTTPHALSILKSAITVTKRDWPLTIDAIVVLPDHLHCIWTLPTGDSDFSTRWRLIKTRFTRQFLAGGGRETLRRPSQMRHGERGVWQRRSWEHMVRDDAEFEALCNYIHYNPVKHGLVCCPSRRAGMAALKFFQICARQPL
jgi:putative transposase